MCGRGESFYGKFRACLSGGPSPAKFLYNGVVVKWVTNESDTFMVLRRGADESYTADVDVFDSVCVGDIWLAYGLFKGIEVYGDQVNIVPAKIEELFMVFLGEACKESTMDGRVEGLNSSA